MENVQPVGGDASLTPRESTLLRAVQRGDYGVLACLLRSPSNGDHQEERVNLDVVGALLIEASGREHLDCIELLLQRMMTPSPRRNLKRRGCFPMHKAAGAGAVESIELLLSAGLSPKTRDHSGRTPLHFAAVQGSPECVSFLCTVARSTVLSRDRATGDTPLHFAVRARHGVCIEVLLSHARRDRDILREPNAKGDTPLDVAAALDDNAVLWALQDGDRRRRRRHSNTGDTSLTWHSGGRRGGGVEAAVGVQRIMAVWERFFENAAAACVGDSDSAGVGDGGDFVQAPGSFSMYQQVHDSNDRRHRSGGARPRVLNVVEEARRGGSMDLRLSPPPPDSSAVARTPRFCAWENNKPMDPVLDQQGDNFGGLRLRELTPRHQVGEGLHIQVESEAPLFSSDDADLHLFHTPRGGDVHPFHTPRGSDITSEAEWLPTNHEGALQFTLKTSPSAIETSGAEANPASSNALHHHQAWVACWDDASQSIYYWNSDSGELTWAEPVAMTAWAEAGDLDRLPTRVWDPQREAFFTIDQDGASHWLEDPPSSPTSASTIPLAESRAAGDGTGSPVIYSVQGVTKEALLSEAGTDPEDMGVWLTPSCSVANAECCREDVHEFYQPEERSYRDVSSFVPETGAGREYEVGVIDGETDYYGAASAVGDERPSSVHTAGSSSASVVNTENANEQKAADGLNFFDSKTCDDCPQSKTDESEQEFCRRQANSAPINMTLALLSTWVLWCSTPSGDDDGTPPYFVNEETCTSSWVLPPEAVMESGGWLRAWSEEHQAWYYANHWTGGVTWDLQDLDTER